MKRVFLVFFSVLFVKGLLAQLSFSVQERYNQIALLDKADEQKYQTSILLDEVLDALRQGELNDSLLVPFKVVVSPDSSFKVIYLPSSYTSTSLDLNWFILFPGQNENRVYRFSNSFVYGQLKSAAPYAVEALVTKYQIEGTPQWYNKLQFSLKSNQTPLITIDDVWIKCALTDLALQELIVDKNDLENEIATRLKPFVYNSAFFGNSFNGFDKLGTLFSQDEEVKVMTWNSVLESGVNQYYGYIVRKGKGNQVEVWDLKEAPIKGNVSTQQFDAKHWYGHNYYQIIDAKDDAKEKYYLLLGARTNDEVSKSKVIETLFFTSRGDIKFGKPVFQNGKAVNKRMVYEYAYSIGMMLRYDEASKMIVMDHLSPKRPEYKGDTRFYVPDFSYDGFKLEKGVWTLVPDIDLRNPSRVTPTRKPKSNKL